MLRYEGSRHFRRKKRREYLKDKINGLASNRNNKTSDTCKEE
jgi:hypothetical protein